MSVKFQQLHIVKSNSEPGLFPFNYSNISAFWQGLDLLNKVKLIMGELPFDRAG
jgi:hypothetical protein